MLWPAVTPEPQWLTTLSGGVVARSAPNSSRSCAADFHVMSAARLCAYGRLSAPGMCPATEPLRRPRIDERERMVREACQNVIGTHRRAYAANCESRRAHCGHRGCHGPALARPLGKTAIEERHGV